MTCKWSKPKAQYVLVLSTEGKNKSKFFSPDVNGPVLSAPALILSERAVRRRGRDGWLLPAHTGKERKTQPSPAPPYSHR
jgi:hypothetical protein